MCVSLIYFIYTLIFYQTISNENSDKKQFLEPTILENNLVL